MTHYEEKRVSPQSTLHHSLNIFCENNSSLSQIWCSICLQNINFLGKYSKSENVMLEKH